MRMSVGVIVGVLGAEAPPSGSGGGTLLTVLVAILGGGLATAAVGWIRQRQQGPAEKSKLEAEVQEIALRSAREMFDEYRRELDEAKREIKELREKLSSSNERIARLESDLAHANGDRNRLQAELRMALFKRGELSKELEQLRQRVAGLEGLVDGPTNP